MSFQDCIQFATENPVCYLATMDGDQPRVRTYLLWFADENGFYFATFSPKGVCKQLQAHPLVEVCFYNNATDLGGAKHMRVTGTVEFVDDLALKTRLLETAPFTSPLRRASQRIRSTRSFASTPVKPISGPCKTL